METLCAYVRENSGEAVRETEAIRNIRDIPSPQRSIEQLKALSAWEKRREKRVSIDVQAALNVLGRRSERRIRLEQELRNAAPTEDAYKLDLSGSNLPYVVLSGMNFEHACFTFSNLKSAQFDNAKLMGARFRGADIENAHFDQADCFAGWFAGARADGAEFCDCRLASAWLAAVNFGMSSFSGANLEGAIIVGSDLSRSFMLGDDQVATAHGDASTRLPEGVQRPDAWPAERTLDFMRSLHREYASRLESSS